MKFLVVLVVLAVALIAFLLIRKHLKRKPVKSQASAYSQPYTYSGSTYTSRSNVTEPRKPVTRTKPVIEKPHRRSEDDSAVVASDDYDAPDFGYYASDDSGYTSEPTRYEPEPSSYTSHDSGSSYSSGSSDSGSSSSSYGSDSGSSSSSSDYGSSSSGGSDY
jgi:uncharacterized membrane protein YgcG